MSNSLRRSILALTALSVLIAIAAPSASAAPTASFTVSPALRQSGVPVTFTSTSTAPTLFTISNTEWDFNNDGTFDGTGATIQHTFPSSGSYTVAMRVTSTELVDNQATASQTVGVLTRAPTAAFSFNPSNPSVGDDVLFASNSTDPDNESLAHTWDFGDGSGPSGTRNPTHQYTTPGTKTVRLTVNDGHGGTDDQTAQVVVRDPSAATASFSFTPGRPVAGQAVTFRSTSVPSAGQAITGYDWDLDSDGQFDDATGATARRAFDTSGVYRVALRVRQANGNPSVAEGTVRVGNIVLTPQPPPNTPTVPRRPAKPSLLSPFPVVRLLGQAYVHRTLVKVLSIRAPRGALARVRCTGKDCPKVVRRKRSKGGALRFKTFERSIKAGASLKIYVQAKKRVGKYTRFKMRRGKPPLRTDLCLVPGKKKPRPCPS